MTKKSAADPHLAASRNTSWISSLEKTASALRDELAKLGRTSATDLSEAASEIGRAQKTSEPHVLTLEMAFVTTVDTLAYVCRDRSDVANDERERLIQRRGELLGELSDLRRMLGKVRRTYREYHKLSKSLGVESISKSQLFGVDSSDIILQMMTLLQPCLAACVATDIDLRSHMSEEVWDDLRVYWAQQLYRAERYTWNEISALLFLDEHDAGTKPAGDRLSRRVYRADRTKQESELKEQLEQAFRKQDGLVQELLETEKRFDGAINDVVRTLNEQNFEGYPLGYLYLYWSGAEREGLLGHKAEVQLPAIPSSLTRYVDEFRRFYEASRLGLAELADRREKLHKRIMFERALYQAQSAIYSALSS